MGSTLVEGTTCIRSIDVFRRSQLFSDFLRMTSIDHVLARVNSAVSGDFLAVQTLVDTNRH